MSETLDTIVIHTGGDPRHLPEFEALRQEINKANHPAQPEVNWRLVESLALTLFRRNGVDLQTATYYTLARTRLAGLAGFTEGCELLAGMVATEWARCWPSHETARIEILDWFTARIGGVLRLLVLGEADLRQLYRAERALQLICNKLQQTPLRRLPRVENLLVYIQNSLQRLDQERQAKNRSPAHSPSPSATLVWLPHDELPLPALPPLLEPTPVTSAPTDSAPRITVQLGAPPARYPRWQGFVLGLVCCLLGLGVAGSYYLKHTVQPLRTQLASAQAQLTALGQQPEGATLLWLQQPTLEGYTQQLARLAAQSPFVALTQAAQSIALAKKRWPDAAEQQAQTQRWEQAHPVLQDTTPGSGYAQVQQRLAALSALLVEQERQKGGVTISYLKTAVYQMQTELQADVPLEALLRQLAQQRAHDGAASTVLLTQIDARWQQLASQYWQLAPRP